MTKLIKLALGILLAYPATASVSLAQTTSGLPSIPATSSTLGSVQPDNVTTTVDPITGIFHSLATSAPATPQYIAPQAIAGCGVEYVTGLQYTVGSCTYSINGITYQSAATPQNITLAAADPTNPRIDVIFIDSTLAVQKITGTPGATPQQPVVDPSTQLQLTFILVPATATTPANTVVSSIYLENTEWTGAVGGTNSARVNLASTNNPYLGTKDVEFGNGGTVTTTTYAQFTKPSSGTENLSNYNSLTFYMRNKAAWPNTRSVTVQWYNGSTPVGIAVVLSNGAFGWNARTNTTGYQQVLIPVSTFGIPGTPVGTLRFTVAGSGSALTGFYLDQITLQGGNAPVILPTTLMNFKGPWSASAAYSPNDLVTSSGFSYVALAANTNIAVSTTATWALLSAGTVTSVSFTGGIVSVANPSSAPALTVAGTSGGVPCFTSPSTWASSGALTANVLLKGGGPGACPTNSLTTDNGTSSTYTGAGGQVAVTYTANGTTAGFIDYVAGITSAGVAPCNTGLSWCVQAPASLSGNFIETLPTPSTGVILHTLSGSTITDTIITPYVKPVVAAISSATGGSGTGTVTCLTAACTNISGTYSVVGGTFTTGTFLTLVWPTTATAYNCLLTQNGGIATYGVGHGVATATGMTVTAGISILGITVVFDYSCSSL